MPLVVSPTWSGGSEDQNSTASHPMSCARTIPPSGFQGVEIPDEEAHWEIFVMEGPSPLVGVAPREVIQEEVWCEEGMWDEDVPPAEAGGRSSQDLLVGGGHRLQKDGGLRGAMVYLYEGGVGKLEAPQMGAWAQGGEKTLFAAALEVVS